MGRQNISGIVTVTVSIAFNSAANTERISNYDTRRTIALTSHVMICNVIPGVGALHNIVLFNLSKIQRNVITRRKLRLTEVL